MLPLGQEVPEAEDAHDVIVRFFDLHLGQSAAVPAQF